MKTNLLKSARVLFYKGDANKKQIALTSILLNNTDRSIKSLQNCMLTKMHPIEMHIVPTNLSHYFEVDINSKNNINQEVLS